MMSVHASGTLDIAFLDFFEGLQDPKDLPLSKSNSAKRRNGRSK